MQEHVVLSAGEFTPMVHLGQVGELDAALVQNQSVVLPAVPEFHDDVQELAGPRVPVLVLRAGRQTRS
jgi:hypothetical protein